MGSDHWWAPLSGTYRSVKTSLTLVREPHGANDIEVRTQALDQLEQRIVDLLRLNARTARRYAPRSMASTGWPG